MIEDIGKYLLIKSQESFQQIFHKIITKNRKNS
jgi:hypothetical protein